MKGEEWSYVLGLLLLIIINLLFLWVPKLIGHAIDTLGNGKVGLLGYIGYFFGLMIIITIFTRGNMKLIPSSWINVPVSFTKTQ